MLPEICVLSCGALARVNDVIAGLDIDSARMHENLAVTHGLIYAEAVTMALGRHIGRLPPLNSPAGKHSRRFGTPANEPIYPLVIRRARRPMLLAGDR
ncbi:MAG TPA: hypothetical protein VGA88_04230 [Burkholderiales bacterium]|jgi:3-carboxy-cis,cis-muconate cycloisomerase